MTITLRDTLENETVQIRIKGLGSRYVTIPVLELAPEAASAAASHADIWYGGRWNYASYPCVAYTGSYTDNWYSFFWSTPTQGACARRARVNSPWLEFRNLDFAYEIKTPNPLSMSSGEYTGSFTYTLGPFKDFDMGDNLIPDEPTLKLNFTLTVQHTLTVEIPPGGNQVELIPEGGWQQWVHNGRTPEKLFRDQSFILSTSSRFKMQLQCSRPLGNTCALSNNNGHEVPIGILVTLPKGLGREDGSAVNRQPLLLSGIGTELFTPTRYVDRSPAILHFEAPKQHISEMLSKQGKYTGNVVVIWDSEV